MHACMYACECFSFLFSKMAVVGFCTSISNDNRYNLLNFGNLFNYIYISRNYLSWYVVSQNVLRINFNQEEQRIYKTTGTTHIHIHHTQPTDAKKEKKQRNAANRRRIKIHNFAMLHSRFFITSSFYQNFLRKRKFTNLLLFIISSSIFFSFQ